MVEAKATMWFMKLVRVSVQVRVQVWIRLRVQGRVCQARLRLGMLI